MSARGSLNVAWAVGWTVLMNSAALGMHAITGNPAWVGRWTPQWARGLARGWGLRVTTHGAETLSCGPYIFISNHLSIADVVALFVGLPVQPGFVAKQELRKVPWLGRTMEVGGHVFIDRSSRSKAFRSIKHAAARIRQGHSVVLFPEGSRGAKEEVRPFKKGAFYLAREAGVAVVPVGIRGSLAIQPKGTRRIEPGSVELHIGQPVPPDEVARLSAPELSDVVRRSVAALSAMPLTTVE